MAAPPRWMPPVPLPKRRETGRLVLRWWEPEDAVAQLEALDSTGPARAALVPWLPWAREDSRTVSQCIYNIERVRRAREKSDATDFVIGIFDRRGGAVLGGTGFHRVEPDVGQAEIGYWVRPDRHGQGICTEAVRGLIEWAFAPQSSGGWGFRRIEISCAATNLAS